MNDPQTANQTRNLPRQGIHNSQHYLKVTHATQEGKIIQRIRTLSPIPTPHNQSSHMNQVQIEYQDIRQSTKDIHLKSRTTCQKYIIHESPMKV